MISTPSVAIVILNWNGKNFLEKFLPFVLQSDYGNFSIIVADNASTDDSVTFLQTNYPQIRLLQNSINEGFAKGYNTALKQVEADFYILLNSDVEVEPNWITPIIQLMESDSSIAACQPKILQQKDKNKFEYAGAAGGWMDSLGYPFCRGRVFDFCEIDEGQYDDAAEVFWASGASLFVRASVFHELNGFDEYFFAHQEEIDLCWRMKRLGYKVFAQPASVVYHVGGGTLPMGSRLKVFLNFRNNLVMLSKNLLFFEAIYKIPLRMVLDQIAALKALVEPDFSTFISIEKAHFHFLGWLFFGKRNISLPKANTKVLSGVYRGSVVKEYFINKKNTFLKIVGNNK
ncbi:MAG: glycosyltransferase family 2 protein [Ginsengibacter sp.]